MVLSEAEAEAQLADLRRQRDVLDRAIGDLTFYLELGRRLTSAAAAPGGTRQAPADASLADGTSASPISWPSRPPTEAVPAEGRDALRRASPLDDAPLAGRMPSPAPPSTEREAPAPSGRDDAQKSMGVVDPEPGPIGGVLAEGVLSEGVLARRYGRALIEAALAALDEAGRPLHAGEILAVLTRRGFSLPGHDPVAALNTRLWKRSGPGGPIKRMGDAVYALVEPEDDERSLA